MKKLTIMTIMSAAVLMNSCGLYSKYERPEVNTQGLVRDVVSDTDTLVSTGAESFGNLEWRHVFTDPQLQALIQLGLDHNVDMLNAGLRIDMAKAQLTTARLAFLPQFVFNPSGTLSKVLTGDYKSDWSKTYSAPVDASWQIDIWGKLAAGNRSAKAAYLQTEYAQQATRSAIITNIANLYYTLLSLDSQLAILKDMETLTKDTWDMMKLQKDLGGARETSVVSAEANYYSVQSNVIEMKRQIRSMENTLSLLLGQQAQQIQRGRLEDQSLPSEFATGINIHLLNNRPDVLVKEMTLAQCFYGVEQARASFYPQLSINAEGAYTNSLGSMVANPGQMLLALVGNLTQPIFSQGKLVAGLKVAKAQYQIAYNEWEHSVLSAGSEVSNALVLYNSSSEKAVADQHRVDALGKSVDYTRELFKMGSSSYLEVIAAQQQLLNARISKITDDFNKMQAVVNLYSALGGGRK